MNPNETDPEPKPERQPETQPSVPPPRPPGGKVTSLGAEDPDPGPGGRRRSETVRINLPPKPTAAPTVALSTSRYYVLPTKPGLSAKIWDFILGSLVVGMLPLFSFGLVVPMTDRARLLAGSESLVYRYLASAAFVVQLAVPLVTFYFALRWRQRRRLLPMQWLVLEVLLGTFLAVAAFIFMVVCWGFASLD